MPGSGAAFDVLSAENAAEAAEAAGAATGIEQ